MGLGLLLFPMLNEGLFMYYGSVKLLWSVWTGTDPEILHQRWVMGWLPIIYSTKLYWTLSTPHSWISPCWRFVILSILSKQPAVGTKDFSDMNKSWAEWLHNIWNPNYYNNHKSCSHHGSSLIRLKMQKLAFAIVSIHSVSLEDKEFSLFEWSHPKPHQHCSVPQNPHLAYHYL